MNLSDIFKDEHITQPTSRSPRCTEDGNYYWFKGETIRMVWDIAGDVLNTANNTYIAAADFMADKTVVVRMFNYMGKEIKKWTLENPGTTIEVEIGDDEATENYFARDLSTGTYQFGVEIKSLSGMSIELVNRADCSVEVR